MRRQASMFESDRIDLSDSIGLTIQSLEAYGDRYRHWAVAYSGGKDSSTLLTLIAHLFRTGRLRRPERLTVLYVDTRMEFPPLEDAARGMLDVLRGEGWDCRVVMPAMDDRYFVYMFGRGVPPPSNTFRWCTGQLKVEPMVAELQRMAVEAGYGRFVDGKYRSLDLDSLESDPQYLDTMKRLRAALKAEKAAPLLFGVASSSNHAIESLKAELRTIAARVVPKPNRVLMLTGVRQGESAVRDQRIVMSCGKAGAECGQGWYQESLPEDLTDTLAPILHWRQCLVWDWLVGALSPEYRHGYPTSMVAEAYGLSEEGSDAENDTRTGCNGCPLATRDRALENLSGKPRWDYLAPLERLRPLFRWLKLPENRLRKPGGERRGDGTLSRNQNRMGPLTMEARRLGLAAVLDIQNAVNSLRPKGMPRYDTLNPEEVARIEELIDANTWPNGWSGDEPRADQPYRETHSDGTVQLTYFGA
ncbi:phosphoadenosine phosphosulfate reductase domain-containing protein [Singulisphaera rosea]